MMELNRVFLVGNLTRDPELKYTAGGTAVCDMHIASNRRYRRGDGGEMVEETCFVGITVFGRSAENCNQYLRKGNPILVEGRLKFDQWTSQDGQKRSKHSVVADRVHFFPKSGGGGGGESQSYGQSYRDEGDDASGGSHSREEYDSEVPF